MDIKTNIDVSKIYWKSEGKLFGWGSGPEADWKVMLVAAIFLAIVSIGINAAVFFAIDKEDAYVSEDAEGEAARTINLEKLRSATEYYQDKAAEFQRIQKEGPDKYNDPSA